MRLLAIDTAADWATIAVEWDGRRHHRQFQGYARHSEHLLGSIAALFAEAGLAAWRDELAAIAFAAGPGAFTGVRLAASVAQGLGMALGCPVVPLDSLELVARTAFPARPPAEVIALADARMSEWYARRYRVTRGGGWVPCAAPQLLPADWDALARWRDSERASGEVGVAAFRVDPPVASVLPAGLAPVTLSAIAPEALLAAAVAAFTEERGVPAEMVEPVYVRNRVALTVEEQAQLRGAGQRAVG